MTPEVQSAIVPLVFIAGAVAARLGEHAILDDGPDLTRFGRILVEGLSTVGQVLVVAAGLTVALTWS